MGLAVVPFGALFPWLSTVARLKVCGLGVDGWWPHRLLQVRGLSPTPYASGPPRFPGWPGLVYSLLVHLGPVPFPHPCPTTTSATGRGLLKQTKSKPVEPLGHKIAT